MYINMKVYREGERDRERGKREREEALTSETKREERARARCCIRKIVNQTEKIEQERERHVE